VGLWEIAGEVGACTLRVRDIDVLVVAAAALGAGPWTLRSESAGAVPFPVHDEEWIRARFDCTPDELRTCVHELKREPLAAGLDSVVPGTLEERRIYEAASGMIDEPEKRLQWLRMWSDARVHGEDLGAKGRALAADLRETTSVRP
jgi:hypothetical protein